MSEADIIFSQRQQKDETIKVKQEFIDSKTFYNKNPLSPPSSPCRNEKQSQQQQQQTILINNLNNNQNSSSITIVTSNNNEKEDAESSSTSTINICINNHFNNNNLLNKNEMQYNSSSTNSSSNSATSTPPPLSSSASTEDDEMDGALMNSDFKTGQDVLVQRKDAKFYLGTITAMSATQCLVKFDDLSLYWANYDEISRLNASFTEESAAMCVVCKKSEGVVDECQRCGRGYHKKCSQSSECPRCSSISECRRSLTPFQALPPLTDKSQLPYNIDILTWDTKHRVNDEQIYCYCGKNGQWDEKMLQCCKCLQWFHEQCVKQTVYPLYRGDRFYVFACSICNDGVEFLRRIKMEWVDIVHLLLFNLYKIHKKKYLNLKKDIFPYATSNWASLNLDKTIRNLSDEEIKDNILRTLRTSDRFQSGKEIKKNISNWGLRKYLPPPIQIVIFDSSVKITTQYLKENTLVNLLTEEEGSDKIVLKKIAENVIYNPSDKNDNFSNSMESTSTSSAASSSTSTKSSSFSSVMNLIPKSPKIVPRSSTLRKRKLNSSVTSRSSEEPCPSTSSGTIDDDDVSVEDYQSSSSRRKTGPLRILEELIPRTPSFNGIHNPFRIPSPKKIDPNSKAVKSKLQRIDLSTKLAALKKSGVIIKKRQNLTAGQLKGEILIKKRKLDEKDIIVTADKKVIKRKRGRKNKNERKSGGKPKNSFEMTSIEEREKILNYLRTVAEEQLIHILMDPCHDKLSRDNAINDLRVTLENAFEGTSNIFNPTWSSFVKATMRKLVLEENHRVDGRRLDEFRPISISVDVYKKLHGSAIFQRGQSQVFGTVTFDSPDTAFHPDSLAQMLGAQQKKMFMLHYEFPGFATNQLNSSRPFSRRELGHGMLAEKALKHVIPDDFPYCIRLACQVLESNGSTSMASACVGSLALYDAGVPLKNPVAGVAIGMMSNPDNETEDYKILTDIMGMEDYAGDMDFKIAGTHRGFTAMQLDLKTGGLTPKQLLDALDAGRKGLDHVLGKMDEAISKPRETFKPTVPLMTSFPCPLHKRAVFFRNGAFNAKLIEAETGVKISIDDDANLSLFAPKPEKLQEATTMMTRMLEEGATLELEFGAIYKVDIVEIQENGVYVRIKPGTKPVFIANRHLDTRKVQHASALGLEVGQQIHIQYLGRDQASGSPRFSRKMLQALARK